jgi:uncharacterized protein
MENILITGGTGLIGSRLSELLKARGHAVAFLSRSDKKIPGITVYGWDPENGNIETAALDWATCIIHLAGENIMKGRWTPRQKQRIIDSRVKSGEFLYQRVTQRNKILSAFISASAIGYYGAVTSEHIFKESDPPADDFLGTTCRLWEQMADHFKTLARTVKIRTSPVLSAKGGMLDKLLGPAKFGLAAPLGSGRQYFPWIHIDDLCSIYAKAVEDERMEGAYNAAAPGHVTNKEFMRTLARVLNKPMWLPPVPGFLLKLFLGEVGDVSLKGSRVSSEKILETGFRFRFPRLEEALTGMLKK